MPKWIGTVAWGWLILVGALIIVPIGPICIACGRETISQAGYILSAISIALGLAGLATQFIGPR